MSRQIIKAKIEDLHLLAYEHMKAIFQTKLEIGEENSLYLVSFLLKNIKML
jgi:hypothetical protein